MQALQFQVVGAASATAADQITAALSGLIPGVEVTSESVEAGRPETQRVIDPVALAALILSIPSAVVAVCDLVDRIAKRKRAAEIVEVVQRVQVETKVVVFLAGPDGASVPFDTLTPDRLLEIAGELAKVPPAQGE
ncbi:hypothetical protein [Magnetospirillum fulvum]|uniref:Uncharacterized protein n=1 Tax=Magnetospirillum fulvum TaxID=1082 RepID=A0A1H6J3A7_MAGFU|nr:hypothetical protein [Magnetospirillum fulvum]SEH56110.1 hypothetical protein SAMN04244559_02947 [Magnetospirillum fulvum]